MRDLPLRLRAGVSARGGLVLPLAVGISLRLVTVVALDRWVGAFAFLDDRIYDAVGWSIARGWRGSPASAVDIEAAAANAAYGFYLYVAAIYYVVGRQWIVVKLVGAMISGLVVLAGASAAGRIGGAGLRQPAAWLLALYPSAVFWGAVGLKDGVLATLFLTVVALCLGPLSLGRLTLAAGLTAVAFVTRLPLGVACLVLVALVVVRAALSRRADAPRPSRRALLVVRLLALVIVTRPLLGFVYGLVTTGIAAAPVAQAAEGPVVFDFTPSLWTLARGFLGPFPWAFDEAAGSVYRLLYPGVVLWIALLPAAAVGAWHVMRRGGSPQRAALAAMALYLAQYFVVFNYGDFFRQRFVGEVFFLVLALVGFHRRPRASMAWTAVGLAVVSLAALVQAGTLPVPWAGALALAAAVIVVLGLRSPASPEAA
ncbi:MAG: hypothetical protein ABR575_06835 [Actinomycetota bacterium]